MDRRSWPWKKKSSDKAVTATDSSFATLFNSDGNQVDQGNTKTVQSSLESYTHLTELEDQVKALNEKLLAAEAEVITKENLVKQHTKVAEEAVSGWEKAEAEASALKHQLESVTLLKLTAEERAYHLDDALKECMKQIRTVKEESEQKLHDVVFAKTQQWEKVKAELEAKLVNFEQELLKASAENAALSRSLHERSNILMNISDEKKQADAEVEVLKSDIQSCEKAINSLQYELHVISKELEIRNEEKNMSIRSVDIANKQHLEDVKKISKLEAECQRLRTLVRKKLPGPAALAQMKLEVENLSRDYGETRVRRTPTRGPTPHHFSTMVPDFAVDSMQQFQKENEFLTARLLAMEEETKMLKEALSQRNGELQISRKMCAKTANELRSMEAQTMILNQQKGPEESNLYIPLETTFSRNGSKPPSLTSMSEDGIYEKGICSKSSATALTSEHFQFKKQKDVENYNKVDNANHLELMADFLEMEKLACLSTECNQEITVTDTFVNMFNSENADATAVANVQNDEANKNELPPGESENFSHSFRKKTEVKFAPDTADSPLIKLKSRVATVFDSLDQDVNIGRVLEDIRRIVQDTQEKLPHHSVSCVIEETHSTGDSWDKNHPDEMAQARENGASSEQGKCLWSDAKNVQEQEIKNAVSKINDFIMSLVKEGEEVKDKPSSLHVLHEKINRFFSYVEKVLHDEASLMDFVLILSHVLSEASEMSYYWSSSKGNEGESNVSDCIDKVTLLENKVAEHDPRKENFSEVSSMLSHPSSHPSSHPESEGPSGDNFEAQSTIQKFTFEEFKQMKFENETMEMNLTSCTELLEETKYRLIQTEQNLAELKSQLASSHKSNSLAETQLKCMAESYKLLESHSKELEAEVNLLRTNIETLKNELQEERCMHQENLAKYKDLQEHFERIEKDSDGDIDIKTPQEKEVAAAAQKLAECQETILLLGKQLQALRPQAEQLDSPSGRYLMNDILEDVPSLNPQGIHAHSCQSDTAGSGPSTKSRSSGESPFDGYNSQLSPSDTEVSSSLRSPISSKPPVPRSSSSSSSSSFSNATPDKHGRGFSRFFSKGKK